MRRICKHSTDGLFVLTVKEHVPERSTMPLSICCHCSKSPYVIMKVWGKDNIAKISSHIFAGLAGCPPFPEVPGLGTRCFSNLGKITRNKLRRTILKELHILLHLALKFLILDGTTSGQ